MAKKRTPDKKRSLPYLAAALLCERVLIEPDHVTSAIRIVDTVTLPGEPLPEAGAVLALNLSLLLIFKSGAARGERQLRLRLVNPSRKGEDVARPVINFTEPPEGGTAMSIPLLLKWEREGLYWFEVLLEGKLYTRIPLRVRIAPPAAPQEAPAP